MTTSTFHVLTNTELLKCLHGVDPLASNLSDLLIEMWKRGLPEAEVFGRKLMAGNLDGNLNCHPDARLYDVLEIMCGSFDQPIDARTWLVLAGGYEQQILDRLMAIAVRDNPTFAYEVLDLAERDGDYQIVSKALLSIICSIPATDARLPRCLMRWAQDRAVMPNSRLAIFRRLSELPRSEKVEGYFIQRYIEDDGSDAAMTDAINDALKQRH